MVKLQEAEIQIITDYEVSLGGRTIRSWPGSSTAPEPLQTSTGPMGAGK